MRGRDLIRRSWLVVALAVANLGALTVNVVILERYAVISLAGAVRIVTDACGDGPDEDLEGLSAAIAAERPADHE